MRMLSDAPFRCAFRTSPLCSSLCLCPDERAQMSKNDSSLPVHPGTVWTPEPGLLSSLVLNVAFIITSEGLSCLPAILFHEAFRDRL